MEWHWIGLSWIGIGVVLALGIELTLRRDDKRGPESPDGALLSGAQVFALAAGGPIAALILAFR
jgi:hypothetical protein